MRYRSIGLGFVLVILLASVASQQGLAQPPSYFDLRNVGGQNYVTGVRDQGPYGTCWTHGVMASMESNMLMTGSWAAAGESGEPDLSERHLNWWNGFNTFNNDDSPGNGLIVHEGGDYMVASAYGTRGEGVVREIDAPYYDNAYPPDRYDPDYHYYYARDIEWFVAGEDLSNINTIKQRVMDQGAIGTCVCMSDAFLNYYNYTHYQPPSSPIDPNHAVTIVGWDDYKTTDAPEGPGAWLIKNSWGAYWGLGGYFWISYYDKHSCKHPEMGAVSHYNVEPMRYEHVYSHDYHGWRDTKEDCSEAFNAFTAESGELLQAVSFFTAADNISYTAKIYGGFVGGELVDELSVKSGTIQYHGFHTIDLDDPVAIDPDDDFYVYLYLSDGGHPYDRTSDVPVLLGAQYRTIVESFARPGESYYKDGGVWVDLQDFDDPPWTGTANFCIKGLSVDRGMRVDPPDDFRSEGPVGGPFSPSSSIYQFENKNAVPMSYEITCGSDWITLSGDVSGVLDVYGTGQVTVEINANAASLGEGANIAAVNFVNLTDHVGDDTRRVILAVGEPTLAHAWTLDSDPGWTCEPDWAFGQPAGNVGEHGADPSSGYTGVNVYGYNLNGDYPRNLPEKHLTSQAVNCAGLYNAHLKFWRWLGVEHPDYDHAYVRVSTDGVEWVTVWENASQIVDASWIEMDINISHLADDEETVYLRWTMGHTDGGWQSFGWNIDDIQITGFQPIGTCGDADANGEINVGDVIYLLNYLFKSGDPPACQPITICGDVNLDEVVDLGDALYLLNYLYKGGPAPGSPPR
jgi:C1A family cysteine protease